jgi:ribosomal protein L11 methyltransferase
MRPDRWLLINVECPSAETAALLTEGLFAFGAQAVEERGNALITYLPPPADPEELVERLRARLAQFAPGARFDIRWEFQPERDWAEAWKRGLAPRRVGKRLIVAPSWTKPDAAADDIVITIDPQMAFGTGEHASTRGALRLLEPMVQPGMRVLDVGTGSAVLAIAAARLGADAVLAVESDADALISAAENVERNAVSERVTLEQRLADDDYVSTLGTFDLIVANILSSVIVPLLPSFRRALRPRAALVVAGILLTEADDFRAAAQREGFGVSAEDSEDEWWSAALRRAGEEATAAP